MHMILFPTMLRTIYTRVPVLSVYMYIIRTLHAQRAENTRVGEREERTGKGRRTEEEGGDGGRGTGAGRRELYSGLGGWSSRWCCLGSHRSRLFGLPTSRLLGENKRKEREMEGGREAREGARQYLLRGRGCGRLLASE